MPWYQNLSRFLLNLFTLEKLVVSVSGEWMDRVGEIDHRTQTLAQELRPPSSEESSFTRWVRIATDGSHPTKDHGSPNSRSSVNNRVMLLLLNFCTNPATGPDQAPVWASTLILREQVSVISHCITFLPNQRGSPFVPGGAAASNFATPGICVCVAMASSPRPLPRSRALITAMLAAFFSL